MTRPLTLAAYRALLADVAGRHGGIMEGSCIEWLTPRGSRIAALYTSADNAFMLRPELRAGGAITMPVDPTAALSDLDAARATLLRAIAARDELAGVVVDVSRNAHPDPKDLR